MVSLITDITLLLCLAIPLGVLFWLKWDEEIKNTFEKRLCQILSSKRWSYSVENLWLVFHIDGYYTLSQRYTGSPDNMDYSLRKDGSTYYGFHINWLYRTLLRRMPEARKALNQAIAQQHRENIAAAQAALDAKRKKHHYLLAEAESLL